MVAILQLIYCFLLNLIGALKDVWLDAWDSVRDLVDGYYLSIKNNAQVDKAVSFLRQLPAHRRV